MAVPQLLLLLSCIKKLKSKIFLELWLRAPAYLLSHAMQVGGGTHALLKSDANFRIRSCLNAFLQRLLLQREILQHLHLAAGQEVILRAVHIRCEPGQWELPSISQDFVFGGTAVLG